MKDWPAAFSQSQGMAWADGEAACASFVDYTRWASLDPSRPDDDDADDGDDCDNNDDDDDDGPGAYEDEGEA